MPLVRSHKLLLDTISQACHTQWFNQNEGHACPTCRRPGGVRKLTYDVFEAGQLTAKIAAQDSLLKDVMAASDIAVQTLQRKVVQQELTIQQLNAALAAVRVEATSTKLAADAIECRDITCAAQTEAKQPVLALQAEGSTAGKVLTVASEGLGEADSLVEMPAVESAQTPVATSNTGSNKHKKSRKRPPQRLRQELWRQQQQQQQQQHAQPMLQTVEQQQQQQQQQARTQWRTYFDSATGKPYYALGSQVQWDMPEELRLLEEAKARALAAAAAAAAAAPPVVTLSQAGLLPPGHPHCNAAVVPEPPLLSRQQFEELSEHSKENYIARMNAYKEQQQGLAQYRASVAAHQAAALEQQQQQQRQQQQQLEREAAAKKEQ
jgi:hypothetical protein